MIKNIIYMGLLTLCFISCDSADWTDARKAEAIGYCTSSGNPKEFCECSVSILETIVTYDEFSHWNSEILSGKHPSGDVVSKMMGVGKRVAAECRAR
jgi:hypothetical protein